MDRSRNPPPTGSTKSTGSGRRTSSRTGPALVRQQTVGGIAIGGALPSVAPRAVLSRALSGTPNPIQHGSSVRSTQSTAPTSVPSANTPSLRKGSSVDGSTKRERRTSDKERLSEFKKAQALEKARAEKKLEIEEQIRKERIQLLVAACLSLVSVLFWIIAISLDHWFYVYMDGAPAVGSNKTTSKFTSNAGLWKVCRTIHSENEEDQTYCKYHSLFPSADELKKGEGMDKHVIDYQRTEGFFATVSILLMAMAVSAAFYTVRNSRYMFKRLAAGLYLLSSGTVLMVLEVVITCVRYEKNNVEYNHPKNSSYSYGFCFYTGWIVFFVFLVTAALFLVYSRKRKGDKALDDDDEGQIMGR